MRTAAEGREAELLQQDLEELVRKWDQMCEAIANSRPPKRVLREEDRATSIVRDMLTFGFDSIITDHKEPIEEIQDYLKRRKPEKVKMLKFYRNKVPLFEQRGIEKQIKASFGKTVTMRNGSYLVIEHTEALHVIDVNSGSKNLRGNTLEDNALKINMVAAEEIARQLRLRDMGGIIVIDFIDLKRNENKKKLYQHLKEAMKRDPAKHSILSMSRFGLVQITRQRVRPEVKFNTAEICPACKGTGKINPSNLLTDEIQRDLEFIMQSRPNSQLVLRTHPYVQAHLTLGWLKSAQVKWYRQFFRWIKVQPDTDYQLTEYRFFDANEDEIRLN